MSHHQHDPRLAPLLEQSAPPQPAAETPHADHPALRVGDTLQRAGMALDRALLKCAGEVGLSDAKFRVLDALSAHSGAGCTQAELAGRLHQSESHLSCLVEQLVACGLLQRERHQQDRRKSVIRRTAQGDDVWLRASAGRGALLGRLLRSWSVGELEDAERLLSAMRRALDAPDDVNCVIHGRARLAADP
ncbi:MAG: MarR family transcriptional regulator, partial [Planctomycetaceae bacterium]